MRRFLAFVFAAFIAVAASAQTIPPVLNFGQNWTGGAFYKVLPPWTYQFNFLSGSLDPSITFTRGSTAMYYNSSGILTSSATNTPRFDYNPSTLALNGLLIEQSSTNLVAYNQAYTNAYWASQHISTTDNAATSPDGTSDASRFITDTSSNFHQIFGTAIAVSASTAYTFSAYVKADGWNYAFINGTSGANVSAVAFNLTTGAESGLYTGNTLSLTYGSQRLPNGWWRVWETFTTPAGYTSLSPSIGALNASGNFSGGGTGDGVSGIYVFGAQLEALPFDTSYIPTTTGSVTRSADNAIVSSPSWFNASSGAVVANVIFGSSGQTGFPWILDFNDGLNDNEIGIYTHLAGASVKINAGSASQLDQTIISSIAQGTLYSMGLSYAAANQYWAVNGGAVSSQGAITLPTGISQLDIGQENVSFASQPCDCWEQSITYWNYQLSPTQLQAVER
jgi:hypothetical protein